MGEEWTFPDPKNLAVLTTARVVREGRPILLVSHDEEDGGWQFLDGGPVDVADGLVVGLGEIVARDPTLKALGDLPAGWQAQRDTPQDPWRRSRG